MKSKLQFCNRTLFFKDITRLWPVWAVPLVLLQLLASLPFGAECLNAQRNGMSAKEQFYYGDLSRVERLQGTLTMLFDGAYVTIVAALAVLSAVFVFQYLNQRTAAFQIHSLPVSRRVLFTSHFLAGYLMLLAPLTALLLVLGGISAANGLHMGLALIGYFLETFAYSLFFYSMAVFFVMVSGSSVMSVLMYVVANVLVCGFRYLLGTDIRLFCYAKDEYSMPTSGWDFWFTPALQFYRQLRLQQPDDTEIINLSGAKLNAFPAQNVGESLIYLIPAALLILFALLLYRSRKLERVGDTLVFSWSKIVYRVIFTACSSLILIWLLETLLYPFITWRQTYRTFFYIGVVLLVCSVCLSYIVCDMILQRRFLVFRKLAWLQMGMIAAVMLVLFVAGRLRYDGETDLHAEELSYMQVELEGNTFTLQEAADTDNMLSYIASIRKVEEVSGRVDAQEELEYMGVRCVLLDGQTIYRMYPVSIDRESGELANIVNLLNQKEKVAAYLFPDGTDAQADLYGSAWVEQYESVMEWLSDGDISEIYEDTLYEALLTDLKEGHMIVSNVYTTDGETMVPQSETLVEFTITLSSKDGAWSDDFVTLPVTKECAHTLAALKRIEQERQTQSQ